MSLYRKYKIYNYKYTEIGKIYRNRKNLKNLEPRILKNMFCYLTGVKNIEIGIFTMGLPALKCFIHVGKNPRIVSGGKPQLKFEQILLIYEMIDYLLSLYKVYGMVCNMVYSIKKYCQLYNLIYPCESVSAI